MAKQYREQAIRFQNGEVDLAGVLCLPQGSPPYPGGGLYPRFRTCQS
jgi:hypothetical protein